MTAEAVAVKSREGLLATNAMLHRALSFLEMTALLVVHSLLQGSDNLFSIGKTMLPCKGRQAPWLSLKTAPSDNIGQELIKPFCLHMLQA